MTESSEKIILSSTTLGDRIKEICFKAIWNVGGVHSFDQLIDHVELLEVSMKSKKEDIPYLPFPWKAS